MDAALPVQSSLRPLNQRERFYYLWGGSLLLLIGGMVAAFVWFSLPKPGYLTFEAPAIPSRGVATVFGQFWLVHTLEGGLTALDPRSPDDGCWFEWVTWDQRFINPCSGSKFQVDGTYIEGPSPRNLDRYHMRVTFADGTLAESNEAGDPILLHGREVARLEVDTSQLIPSPASDLAWRSATCRCQAVPVS
jgi:cytochrome b6-f complex iron-sulfur subunit